MGGCNCGISAGYRRDYCARKWHTTGKAVTKDLLTHINSILVGTTLQGLFLLQLKLNMYREENDVLATTQEKQPECRIHRCVRTADRRKYPGGTYKPLLSFVHLL